jgi:hypothetical protein
VEIEGVVFSAASEGGVVGEYLRLWTEYEWSRQKHAIVSLDQCEGKESCDVLRQLSSLRAGVLDLR